MIPLRDINPTSGRPIVTIVIVAINVLVYLACMSNLDAAAWAGGAFPFHFTGMEPEVIEGLPEPPPFEWWSPLRAISSAFMHGGLMHIGMNMLFLWVFGDNIEARLGRVRYVIFYLVCALAAVAGQVISSPAGAIPMIGASGAVSGVLGAYVRLYPSAKVVGIVPIGFVPLSVVWPSKLFIGIWFGMQALSAFMSSGQVGGTAWWAHIGGFVVGFLWAPGLAPKLQTRTIDWDARP